MKCPANDCPNDADDGTTFEARYGDFGFRIPLCDPCAAKLGFALKGGPSHIVELVSKTLGELRVRTTGGPDVRNTRIPRLRESGYSDPLLAGLAPDGKPDVE